MAADPRTIPAESDPVATALADAEVSRRLLAAARAFLSRRASTLTALQRVAEAEQIISEVRARALARRGDYDSNRDVVNWLVGFVINVARDHLRELARTPTGPPPDAPRLEDLATDLGRPVPDTVADKELVAGLLARLPREDGTLLRLKYEKDLTFAEIGERMDLNVNAVRVRHHRIIRRLRQLCAVTGEGQS